MHQFSLLMWHSLSYLGYLLKDMLQDTQLDLQVSLLLKLPILEEELEQQFDLNSFEQEVLFNVI